VTPVALLEQIDEGLYRVALECKNCGLLTIAVTEDAELELLEAAHHQACFEMRRDLARLSSGAEG
jgi:hypothetical protein